MRYLIYSFCYETPHFEAEMEIALNLIKEGHEVFFLVCREELQTCFINPAHEKAICAVCKSKVSNGLKVLGIPNDNILYLSKRPVALEEYEEALSSFQALKDYKYEGSDVGLAVASSLISNTRDHWLDTKMHRSKVKTGLETAILVHENAKLILSKIKPHGVILFNGRFLEARPFIRMCQTMEIDFYTHERGGQIDRYMFRKNSTPHTLAFVKSEIEELWRNAPQDKIEIGRSFFEDRRNKVIQTWHVFTKSQINGTLPANFDKAKYNIGIFNSSMDEYEGIPDFNSLLYKDDNEGIRKLCKAFLSRPEFHFYLRVHPNLKGLNTTQTIEIDKIKDSFENLTVIPADHIIDSYALMEAVDTVVSFGSTMGVEALYWNKHSVLLGRGYFEDLAGIQVPKSHEEAIEIISQKSEVNSNLDAIKYGYWCLTYGSKFKYFEAESLFAGKFLGRRIKADFVSRAVLKLNKTIHSMS